MKQRPGTSAQVLTRSAGSSRRAFNKALVRTAGLIGAGATFWPSRSATSATPVYLSTFDQQHYFAYPHQNAFFDSGRKVVLGRIDGAGRSSLWLYDLSTKTSRNIAGFTLPGSRDFIYYDIAENH